MKAPGCSACTQTYPEYVPNVFGICYGHVFGKGSLPIFVGCCSPEPPEPPPGRKIYKKLRRVPRLNFADVAIPAVTDEVPSARGEADLGVGGDPPR